MMRSIGMDVHRSFAQVAICDDGQITDSFKVDMEDVVARTQVVLVIGCSTSDLDT